MVHPKGHTRYVLPIHEPNVPPPELRDDAIQECIHYSRPTSTVGFLAHPHICGSLNTEISTCAEDQYYSNRLGPPDLTAAEKRQSPTHQVAA